ncbi:hypothetical protein ACLB2K_066534 [Fragaria x ananassa]
MIPSSFCFSPIIVFYRSKMEEQIAKAKPAISFEYQLFEGDPDHFTTVVSTPTPTSPWINPASLNFKYRIGRGPFGDVWLATHHQSADDYDEYHEVAVKMLHPLKEEDREKFMRKFEKLFFRFRRLCGVCWFHGISIIDGRICIAMKFYEGSIGDRVARMKGGKLQLFDVLRYGIELAKGISDVHSLGLLVLNLKPSNILVDEHGHVVLGDFGIPYLLLGASLSNPNMAFRLGTPNYMAPEQWEPEVRGPISLETDSWGFGCCFVEMLTGSQPWFGSSINEVYHSVVIKGEKPPVPSGLPPVVENVINGCFEYDLRNRPSMEDIIRALECSQKDVQSDGEWLGLGGSTPAGKRSGGSCSAWHLLKDDLQVGDMVRSRKPVNARKRQALDVPEGIVTGLESNSGNALVKIPRVRRPVRVSVSTLERVTSGLTAGDWVQLKGELHKHSPVGILHSIQRDGSVAVGFIGLETLWRGKSSDIEIADAYYVGEFVRLKANVLSPRFEWPRKGGGGAWATGRISQVLPNGCLVVRFPGRLEFGDVARNFLADPYEVELVSFDTCPGLVEKYQHVEDFHWAVRPLAIAFGLFTAMKFSLFVGRNVSARVKGRKNSVQGQSGGNSAWLPPKVANLFKEGASTATVR